MISFGPAPAMRGCLGERVSDYVDGTLGAGEQLACDRHLIACQGCRAEIELERRLRATLRTEPAVPDALMAMLMAVSQEIPVQAPLSRPARTGVSRPARAGGSVPSVPLRGPGMPPALPIAPVQVLAPSAPAQHRSALRAAAFATAAAGASVAAVWAFSLAPSAGVRPAPASVLPRPAAEPSIHPSAPATSPIVVRARAFSSPDLAQSTP